jgi:hypothetical protein
MHQRSTFRDKRSLSKSLPCSIQSELAKSQILNDINNQSHPRCRLSYENVGGVKSETSFSEREMSESGVG